MPGLALLLWWACGGEPRQELPAPSATTTGEVSILDASWVAALAHDPQRFTDLVGDERPGWVLFHRNALEQAWTSGGAVGERARRELADLHGALARLSSRAWMSVLAAWSARSGLPEGSAITWFGALAALELGEQEQARAWLAMALDADSTPVREAAAALLDSMDLDTPLPGALGNPLAARFNLHAEARRTGEVGELLDLAREPLWSERGRGDTRRTFYDPQLHWTLAEVWSTPGARVPTVEESLLFSACMDAQDLEVESARVARSGSTDTLCALAPSWEKLGVASAPGDADDPQSARDRVRRLDAALASWKPRLLESVGPSGRELVNNLGLVEILRGRALLAQARHALGAGHPGEAAALAQLAMDMGNTRSVSPLNPPLLHATLAEANLGLGHTREALDSLQVLSTAFPLARGVDEIVGDLAILQGIDRQGDSKEN